MSKKNKLEKRVLKKLHKLMAQTANVSDHESRLVMVTGPYGFSVVRMEEDPDSTSMHIVDRYFHLMNTSIHNALGTNTGSKEKQKPKTIRLIPYDGSTLKDISKQDFNYSQPDYAKMQGIDLDEAADRQMDLYTEGADARKALVMHKATTNRQMDNYIDTTNERKAEIVKNASGVEKELFLRAQIEGIVKSNAELKRQLESYKRDMEGSQKAYEKQKTDLETKETELKHAYDKAAEDYETIQKLTKEVGDLKIQLGKQNEMIFQLKHPTPIEVSSIVPVSEKPNALSTIVMDMNTKIDKLAEKVDGAETKEEEPEEEPEEELSSVFGVTMGKKPFESPVHKDELPDDYMLTLLQNTKKPYNLRTIFKLQSNIYEEIEPAVYMNLIGIRDPRTTNVRNFSRTAYAVAIALSVPESYVGSFMRRLIDDYKYADFKPTDPKYLPEDFPNFVESLYPDIARIHRLLHTTDMRELPYVCKKEVGTSTEYYMIGARPYDNPSDIRDTDYYIAIPKDANPYDFLEYDKTKELVMIFSRSTHNNKHRQTQRIMHDVESDEFRNKSHNVSIMRDQINRYIAADEAGLIAIGCNNPDEILMNGLWFYPVVWGYTVDKF